MPVSALPGCKSLPHQHIYNNKIMKKSELTFKHFEEDIVHTISYIPFEVLEKKMGKRMYKKFSNFMIGQTCYGNGAYPCDVENFFSKNRFFD